MKDEKNKVLSVVRSRPVLSLMVVCLLLVCTMGAFYTFAFFPCYGCGRSSSYEPAVIEEPQEPPEKKLDFWKDEVAPPVKNHDAEKPASPDRK